MENGKEHTLTHTNEQKQKAGSVVSNAQGSRQVQETGEEISEGGRQRPSPRPLGRSQELHASVDWASSVRTRDLSCPPDVSDDHTPLQRTHTQLSPPVTSDGNRIWSPEVRQMPMK